jgi:regulation of enolase protein 1 (concanavalin A-like superfamily)
MPVGCFPARGFVLPCLALVVRCDVTNQYQTLRKRTIELDAKSVSLRIVVNLCPSDWTVTVIAVPASRDTTSGR